VEAKGNRFSRVQGAPEVAESYLSVDVSWDFTFYQIDYLRVIT